MNTSASRLSRNFYFAARLIVFAVSVLSVSHAARAATFTVTNSDNAGPGSLRDAITQADMNAGDDTIIFDLSAAARARRVG